MSVICHNRETFARKPRAVLFDLDNTLYAYAPAHKAAMTAVVNKAETSLGIEASSFLAAFEKSRKAIKSRLGGTAACHSRLLYMQQALELLGFKTQLYMALDLEQTYWRTFMSTATLFPGVKEFIQALRRAGITTCIVTDLLAQIQFRKLIYFGLNDCFDFVVTSEESGADKPAPASFELALAKTGAQPGEALMIGEEAASDIAGAKKAGIATAQKRHSGVEVFTDRRKPDLVFDAFPELEKYFGGLGWLDVAPVKKTSGRKS
ncbi:MAG: HAD family hydrolase [Bdellovibrionales bacterium]